MQPWTTWLLLVTVHPLFQQACTIYLSWSAVLFQPWCIWYRRWLPWVYQLITPKQTAATTVNYILLLTMRATLNSLPATSFSSATGDICTTPQALEVTVMAVNVLEYRNGVFIGSVERDLPDYSNELHEHSANTLPVLMVRIISPSLFVQISKPASTSSPMMWDAGQQLTVTWDNGIPGEHLQLITVLHPTGTFCWTQLPLTLNSYFYSKSCRRCLSLCRKSDLFLHSQCHGTEC